MLAQLEVISLGVASVALFCVLVCMIILYRLHKDLSMTRKVLKSSKGERIDHLLVEHFEQNENMNNRLGKIEVTLNDLSSRVREQIGKVGFVRYDAFEDMGGEQSFVVAWQNEKGDGILINSITGRESIRLFCKPLRNGINEHGLSAEEQRAIENAITGSIPEKVS